MQVHDVQTSTQFEQALRVINSSAELAVDLEADSMHAFRPRLCFIQIATAEDIFLVDTLALVNDLHALGPVFNNSKQTKIFHAAGGDLQFLASAGLRVNGLFDTHRAVTLLGAPKVGLADLVAQYSGAALKKEHQQSDFALRPLPPALREYIADDVRYLLAVGRAVRQACIAKDILEEVELDCRRLAEEALPVPEIGSDYVPKFSKGKMSSREIQLAQAICETLHRLRLKWASEANIPMGRMLSNAAIAAIAERPPTTASELNHREGVRGPWVKQYGEEVLLLLRDLIAKSRAGELPSGANPTPPDWNVKKRAEALKLFRTQQAAEREVNVSVILTNPLLEALAKDPPRSLEQLRTFPYFGEKRTHLYGADILRLLI